MNFNRIAKQIDDDEGFKSSPYLDTAGVWTIGIGTTHIAGKAVTSDTPSVTRSEAEYHRNAHIFQSMLDAQASVSCFETLPTACQEVLVMMAYQLGISRFRGFKRFISAICAQDFRVAAAELRNSKWYRQTTSRVERHASIIEAL